MLQHLTQVCRFVKYSKAVSYLLYTIIPKRLYEANVKHVSQKSRKLGSSRYLSKVAYKEEAKKSQSLGQGIKMNLALRRVKQKINVHPPTLRYGRARLTPLLELSKQDWKRIEVHFRDPEIAWLNGTPPNRMPLWLLKRILRADSRRKDRETFGVFDENNQYIGTIELYDIRFDRATLGIIIGERSHWSKGYGPEAINALLEFAFLDLDLRRIVLNTFADNPRAKASFSKIGFSETKRSQNYQNRINIHMQLNKNHWLDQRGSAKQTSSVTN